MTRRESLRGLFVRVSWSIERSAVHSVNVEIKIDTIKFSDGGL